MRSACRNKAIGALALALAVVLGFAAPATAACVANRHISGVESAIRSAARVDDPVSRERHLTQASRQIDALSEVRAGSKSEDAEPVDEYVRIRRDDVDRLARDPRSREIGASFATISVTAGVRMGECVLRTGGREVSGALKGYAVDSRQGDSSDATLGAGRRSAADGVFKAGRDATRMVEKAVQRAREEPRQLIVLALLPVGVLVYRLFVFLNRRRAVRYICCIPAQVSIGDKVYNARIFDFSRLGAKIAYDDAIPDEKNATLDLRVEGLVIRSRKVWSAQLIMGMQFETPLGTNAIGQLFELARSGAGLYRM